MPPDPQATQCNAPPPSKIGVPSMVRQCRRYATLRVFRVDTLFVLVLFGGSALEQEPSLSSSHCQTESEGNVLLQLLEFKSHLLEAVEELHIRRDAETRLEDQISRLVLEKQELEWEKDLVQNQLETEQNQHTEALATVKKQFQVKLQSREQEKGKYQVTAELKDKEINNLKEELKSLQLLKYNLEKKSSELEQKLALQSRAKDTHLNQLGEVEKRFSALSRQCSTVKQAHEELEQNVDEAMRINRKLTAANQKQEATIVSLKKELDEVSNRLLKVKMTSATHDKTRSPTSREQHVQELQLKLNLETELNRKLEEENAVERAEKQELVTSLQHTQQLLLSQTQAARRAEQELQTQRDVYQALQHKHEAMREKSKAMEDKVAQLMQDCAASRTSWDKEKMMLLDQMKSEQKELRAVKEAYEDLHQKRADLSHQAKSQVQHQFSSRAEDARGGETLEPVFSSEQTGLIHLQPLVSQARTSDCQEDAGAVLKIAAARASGGLRSYRSIQLPASDDPPVQPP
ncbi:coiled-coil domain-containing protein 73 [Xenentodon cancila]